MPTESGPSEASPLPASAGDAPKPKSAWLVQALAIVLATLSAYGILRFTVFVMSSKYLALAWGPSLLAMAWRLLLIAALTWTVVAVERRGRMGHLLGLVLIAGVFCWMAYLNLLLPKAAAEGAGYSNPKLGRGVESALGLAALLAIGAWFYVFGFSKASRKYFAVSAP